MIAKELKPIMFVGTGSDVGKSVVNTAFCRVFFQDGYNPAPFKAQNMSLNSYATNEDLEIGRAQAVQAEACGIECLSDMNPVLLKPTDQSNAQVVLNGKPAGNKSAAEYFNKNQRDGYFKNVTSAYNRLKKNYNPIVIEGAGSISEVNLWSKDIVNMRMALYSKASVFLVADIDKGGIFGSLYGTVLLLPEEERKAIRGIIINKFRGDIKLFSQGKEIIEKLTGIPVVGILPWFDDIFIEQEDSVILDNPKTKISERKVNVAVILLKHLSNFTDFNTLAQVPGINLIYTRNLTELQKADIIIIPGSKNTIADLAFLRSEGLAGVILRHYSEGKPLYGICGGFQIMGEWIHDPFHIEGEIESMPGLGIFPVQTTLEKEKKTRKCKFSLTNFEGYGEGYEIHSGITSTTAPFAVLDDGTNDGYYLNPKTWGTYIHGVFDNTSIISSILEEVKSSEKIEIDYKGYKEKNYNLLADWVRNNVNMEYIYKTLEI